MKDKGRQSLRNGGDLQLLRVLLSAFSSSLPSSSSSSSFSSSFSSYHISNLGEGMRLIKIRESR